MTREEAIEELELLLSHWDELESGKRGFRWYSKTALEVALTALRPVSREQVGKVWRGKWKCHGDCGVTECSICGWNIEEYVGNYNFCPVCGAPMTDEAAQMVMERMEKLKDADTNY